MGMMKEYLMTKVHEFANKIGVDEAVIYADNLLYEAATRYAALKMKAEYLQKLNEEGK